MEPKTLPGFRDFLPEQALKRQWLKEKLEVIFEIWGYDPMETPTLEPVETAQETADNMETNQIAEESDGPIA